MESFASPNTGSSGAQRRRFLGSKGRKDGSLSDETVISESVQRREKEQMSNLTR
jgi:hypothetical protein